MALINKLTAIGDAIRAKTSVTESMTLDQMAVEISNISTGVELNFDVVGGTIEPSNPNENTIWVNTDVPIGAWYFNANNPFLHTSDIYTEEGATTGKYLNSSGVETSSTNWTVTDKILLPDGTISVEITAGSSTASLPHHWFYDADGNAISGFVRKNGTATYEVPEGAKSIRVSLLVSEDVKSIKVNYMVALEGDVWFSTGVDSHMEFNALEKNGIQVYPLSAKQYVDGVLVDVEAKTYQNGEWVDWIVILVDGSNLNTTYAGAWNKTTGSQGAGGSATMTSEGLLIVGNKGTDTYGTQFRYGPDETINFNNINTIEFIVSNKSGSSALCAWVTPVFATSYTSTSVASIGQKITTTNQIISMDVSDVNGEYYLRVGTSTSKNNAAHSYVIHSLTLK